MDAPRDRSTSPRCRARVLYAVAAVVAFVAGGMPLLAQDAGTPVQPSVGGGDVRGGVGVGELADITGRDFAGVRLPVEPVTGPILFRASKASVWTEPSAPTPVQRLFLEGDVRVVLGVHQFDAARAVVWLQKLGAGEYQVFVYFDRVGTANADATISVAGDRLRVQGVLKVDRPIKLTTDLRREGRPADPLLREAEAALTVYLTELVFGTSVPEPSSILPGVGPGVVRAKPRFGPGLNRPFEPGAVAVGSEELAGLSRDLPPSPVREPIFAKTGLISFSPGRVTVVTGADENAVMFTDGVVVQYWDRKTGRTLQITAERAVAFLASGPLAGLAQLDADAVHGVYLEGDVIATDGKYTLRGPRMYYDVQQNRAVVIDAVFWTYDERHQLPLYVRAETIRQESADDFSAANAKLTNSAFFVPHLSIGASSVTISRKEGRGGRTRHVVDARHITLRSESMPFFYWPGYKGDPSEIPLRDLAFESSSGSGAAIKTSWDAFGLLRLKKPYWLGANILIDEFFERGPAVGTSLWWDDTKLAGRLDAYLLPYDTGTDLLTSGARIDHDGETRGMLTAEHRWALTDQWTLFGEVSYISDETFVDTFFERQAESRREFTNAVRLRRLDGNTTLDLTAKAAVNDFTPNEYLLQSRGYMVDKLPEVEYHRIADDLLPGAAPGLISYTSEYRAGMVAMRFVEPTAAELGLDTTTRSRKALGIEPGQSIADTLRARGLTEDGVLRFDTRHELSTQLALGPVNIVPFAVGRVTVYDDSFEGYSSGASDQYRLFGSLGVRATTTIQKVDESVESRLLDLHRIRHIIQPGVTLWTSGASIDQADLPVYDESVESLADGSVIRLSLDQTWQTKRGGPGRWRSVDVLTLSTELVLSSEDADPESPIGRFFDDRPELSNLGDFGTIDAAWQITDAFGVGVNTIYDFDASQPARTIVGTSIRHTPNFRTYADLRFINALDSTYLSAGAFYQVTPKYDIDLLGTYDDKASDLQTVRALVTRRFPNVILGVGFTHNNIKDETSFGIIIKPIGLGAKGVQLRGVGAGSERSRSSRFGG